MATYTANYGLHQWVPEDVFVRTDFNEDLAKIDTALGNMSNAKAELVIGTYVGDGAASRTINLGFQPKALLLENNMGERKTWGFRNVSGGFAMPGQPLMNSARSKAVLSITGTSFQVLYEEEVFLNTNGVTYIYIAVQ